jgi:hypothetical protein
MSPIRVNERLAFGRDSLINVETALISTAFDLIAEFIPAIDVSASL